MGDLASTAIRTRQPVKCGRRTIWRGIVRGDREINKPGLSKGIGSKSVSSRALPHRCQKELLKRGTIRIAVKSRNSPGATMHANVVEARNRQAAIAVDVDEKLFLPSHENVFRVCKRQSQLRRAIHSGRFQQSVELHEGRKLAPMDQIGLK